MKHSRVIITEAGACVSVTHLIQGYTEDAVIQRAHALLRATINSVVYDNPKATPSPDEIQAAQRHGTWWADLGSETFTVMIAEPEQIDCPDPTEIQIDVHGGRVNQVQAPGGTIVVVRDYDTEGIEQDRVDHDATGRPYVETRWERGTS